MNGILSMHLSKNWTSLCDKRIGDSLFTNRSALSIFITISTTMLSICLDKKMEKIRNGNCTNEFWLNMQYALSTLSFFRTIMSSSLFMFLLWKFNFLSILLSSNVFRISMLLFYCLLIHLDFSRKLEIFCFFEESNILDGSSRVLEFYLKNQFIRNRHHKPKPYEQMLFSTWNSHCIKFLFAWFWFVVYCQKYTKWPLTVRYTNCGKNEPNHAYFPDVRSSVLECCWCCSHFVDRVRFEKIADIQLRVCF